MSSGFFTVETLWATLLFATSVLFCLFIINLIPYAYVIRDAGHWMVGQNPTSMIPEIIVGKAIVLFLVLCSQYALVLRQLAVFMFFRGTTMWMTVLPSLKKQERLFMYGLFGGHNDYVPVSGHMGFLWILCFHLSEVIGCVVWFYVGVLLYYSLAERRHYTVELFTSMAISWGITQIWT